MKRLKLAAFQAKQTQNDTANMDQLLGQVLGDCHDQPKKPRNVGGYANESEEVQN